VARALSGGSLAAALERLGAGRGVVPRGAAVPETGGPPAEHAPNDLGPLMDRAGPAARSAPAPSRSATAAAGPSALSISPLEASLPRFADPGSADARTGTAEPAAARHLPPEAEKAAPTAPAAAQAVAVPRAAAIALASPSSGPGVVGAPGQPAQAAVPLATSAMPAATAQGGSVAAALQRIAGSPAGSVPATTALTAPSAVPPGQAPGATRESPAGLPSVPARIAPDLARAFPGGPGLEAGSPWAAPAPQSRAQSASSAPSNPPAPLAAAGRPDPSSSFSPDALEPLRALGQRQLEELQALRRLEEQRFVGPLPATPRGGRPVNAR
jgi:hypothetical protein